MSPNTTHSRHRHAIVVGAGFGGIAAAIRLRTRGYRVTLIEANEQLGGRASVFESDGFRFDAGPTVITAPYLIDELFELAGRRREDHIELLPVDPFYRVSFSDGSVFDYVGQEDRLLEQIRGFEPRDVEGYLRMADHARRIFEVGYQELAHQPFGHLNDMLRVVPDMLRLRNHRTVYGLVSSYLRDERLRQVFTFQPLLIGGNPFRTSSIYLLIHWLERKWGVHFARGGTGAIVAALGQLMDELGIEVRLHSPVEEIVVAPGGGRARGVRLESGLQLDADVVVCNADPSMVYTRMIAKRHRRWNPDWRIQMTKQSMSLFVVYLGASKQWPDVAHHTILLGPRYRELLEDIFERKILADDFSLYLHAPTRTDPSLAPPGHENLYVLSPVPNEQSGIDWERAHQRYRDRIVDWLDANALPGLKDHLVTELAVDPRYFSGRLRSHSGAAFGPEPRLSQSAFFRFHNRCPDIDGLYFVGAGTHPGAGVPGVLSSARVLDSVVPDVPSAMRMPFEAPYEPTASLVG